jgi:hypothetical protein
MRLRLLAASAAMAAAAAFVAISPAAAQASSVGYVTTQGSHAFAAATSQAVPNLSITVYAGHFASNRACAARGAQFVANGAHAFHCDRNPAGGWDLYVVYLIL